jgi:hypothetical protein
MEPRRWPVLTFFDRPEDVERLRRGLLGHCEMLPTFRSYLTHGAPHEPRSVELFARQAPKTKHVPIAIFHYDAETGRLELLYPGRPQRSWRPNASAPPATTAA